VQQIADANCAARISLGAPRRHRRRIVDGDLAFPNENADERGGNALSLGPADLRRVRRPSGCVALADDFPGVDDDDRARVVFALGHAPVERRRDRMLIDAGRHRRRGVLVAHRPRRRGGIAHVARDGDRREVKRGLAARQDRAPLVAVELRRARREAGPADGHRPMLVVHAVGEARVPAEILERRDVFRQDLLRRPFVHLADDPQAGAQMMRANRGARLEAVRAVHRRLRLRTDDQQRGRCSREREATRNAHRHGASRL